MSYEQTFDLKTFRSTHERCQLFLNNSNFSFVHKTYKSLQIFKFDVFHINNSMFFAFFTEHSLNTKNIRIKPLTTYGQKDRLPQNRDCKHRESADELAEGAPQLQASHLGSILFQGTRGVRKPVFWNGHSTEGKIFPSTSLIVSIRKK